MITPTDRALAARFLPALAGKKDIVSTKKLEATAKAIAAAMLPERAALADLVSTLENITTSDEWRAFWNAAKAQNIHYRGPIWKKEFDAAKAIVETYPLPEIEGQ